AGTREIEHVAFPAVVHVEFLGKLLRHLLDRLAGLGPGHGAGVTDVDAGHGRGVPADGCRIVHRRACARPAAPAAHARFRRWTNCVCVSAMATNPTSGSAPACTRSAGGRPGWGRW